MYTSILQSFLPTSGGTLQKKTSSDKHHFVYLFNVCVLLSVCFQIADIFAQLLKFYSLGVFFLQPRQAEVRHSAEELSNALCATWQMKYWDSRCIEGFGIFLLAEVGIYCKKHALHFLHNLHQISI